MTGINIITPQQAQEWLNQGSAILIDVREPDEFMAEHIPHAISIPLGSIELLLEHIQIPPHKKLLFQCLKGGRAQQACNIIHNKTNNAYEIYNIAGGITGWKESGLAVIGQTSKKTIISLFRQVQIIIGTLLVTLLTIGLAGYTIAFFIAIIISAALLTAGITGWCGLMLLLQRMPWNK